MHLWVSLLRGINVGGHRKVPMAELRELYESEGCTSVTSYIQSGNVLFRSAETDADALSATMSAAIEDRFGFDVSVIHLLASDLLDIAANSPYADIGADEKQLGVAFLGAEPSDEVFAALDPDHSPPDTFARGKRAIYLHLPGGFAKTKLSHTYLEKQLGIAATVRNWRTVRTLVERSQSDPYV